MVGFQPANNSNKNENEDASDAAAEGAATSAAHDSDRSDGRPSWALPRVIISIPST